MLCKCIRYVSRLFTRLGTLWCGRILVPAGVNNHPMSCAKLPELPEGALGVAAPTCRCVGCASAWSYRADYHRKYVYPDGVFHANCYAEKLLWGVCFEETAEAVEALVGSGGDTPWQRPGSAEVLPLQESWWPDGGSLSDAHLAVLVE